MVSIIDNFNFNIKQRSQSSMGYYNYSSENTIDGGESDEITDINCNEILMPRSNSEDALKRQKQTCSERPKSTLPGGGKKRKYIPVKKFVTSTIMMHGIFILLILKLCYM